MRVILGIDPGATGCLALVGQDKVYGLGDIDRSVNGAIHFIRNALKDPEIEIIGVVIEAVRTMQSQGRKGLGAFLEGRGQLKGCCQTLDIPILAEPGADTWKRKVGISLHPPKRCAKNATEPEKKARKQAKSRYDRDMKTVSRNRAMELFPSLVPYLARVKDDGRAEAALLGHYGWLLKGAV